MKQIFELNGAYAGKRVRRLKKVGRVELLRVVYDSEEDWAASPWNAAKVYWFVRIAGFDEQRDRPILVRCGSKFGNGYFRFCQASLAEAQFNELATQPESVADGLRAQKLRDEKRERFLAMVQAGKVKPFQKNAQKTSQS